MLPHWCVCVCVILCVYICVSVCLCVCMCECVQLSLCRCRYVLGVKVQVKTSGMFAPVERRETPQAQGVCVCVCVILCVYICVSVCMCVCMCECVQLSLCRCRYVLGVKVQVNGRLKVHTTKKTTSVVKIIMR